MMYQVYGLDKYSNSFYDYIEAENPQKAVDLARMYHEEDEEYVVMQIAKIIKNWK